MNRKYVFIHVAWLLSGSALARDAPPPPPFAPALPNLSAEARRGEHLVVIGGCHDCHTPSSTSGPHGGGKDFTRMLSGHPEQVEVPAAPPLSLPWVVAAAGTFTAFAGPWGTSYAANLTPDKETGLGSWTEQNFIEAMRTGRHLGRGRPILPPMPWIVVGQHTDPELHAIWAYLRSVPAIRNEVPTPRPPVAAAAAAH